MAEDLDALAARPGWTVDGPVATFAPRAGDWYARVRQPQTAERPHMRWHVAIVAPSGSVAYTSHASSVAEARRTAEGQVRARLEKP